MEEEIDMRVYFNVVWKRKGVIIAILLIGIAISVVVGRNCTILVGDKKAVDAVVNGYDERHQRLSNQEIAAQYGRRLISVD